MKKLFGETPQEQLKYLQPRIIITAIAIALSLVGLLFHFEEIAAVLGVVCLMWGWTFLKAKFGIVSLGALFTRNIIAGISRTTPPGRSQAHCRQKSKSAAECGFDGGGA